MRRAAVGVVALVVISGVLSDCGREPGASTTPGATAVAGAPASSVAAPAPAGPVSRMISVTVRGGHVSGDTGRITVPLGTPVTLSVTSDVADEVHVHGYDKTAQIPPGGTGSLTFTANIPGVFEVELHESGAQLVQLQVS